MAYIPPNETYHQASSISIQDFMSLDTAGLYYLPSGVLVDLSGPTASSVTGNALLNVGISQTELLNFAQTPPVISTYQLFGIPATTSLTAFTWPASNQAILIPFGVSSLATVMGFVSQPYTSSYYFDIGIYNLSFKKMCSLGATACPAAASYPSPYFLATPTPISPGWYYLAMSMSSTSAYDNSIVSNTSPVYMGVLLANNAYPLPGTISGPNPYYSTGTVSIPALSIFFQ